MITLRGLRSLTPCPVHDKVIASILLLFLHSIGVQLEDEHSKCVGGVALDLNAVDFADYLLLAFALNVLTLKQKLSCCRDIGGSCRLLLLLQVLKKLSEEN